MVAPFAAPLALALLFQPCTGLPAQDAAQLREQGRYAQALELAQALTDPTQRAREVLETHYHAGDLAGALGAGLQGLEHAPRDRWLLWRSTRLATDMAAAPLALDPARQIGRAGGEGKSVDLGGGRIIKKKKCDERRDQDNTGQQGAVADESMSTLDTTCEL